MPYSLAETRLPQEDPPTLQFWCYLRSRTKTLTNWYNPCAFANPLSGNDIPLEWPGFAGDRMSKRSGIFADGVCRSTGLVITASICPSSRISLPGTNSMCSSAQTYSTCSIHRLADSKCGEQQLKRRADHNLALLPELYAGCALLAVSLKYVFSPACRQRQSCYMEARSQFARVAYWQFLFFRHATCQQRRTVKSQRPGCSAGDHRRGCARRNAIQRESWRHCFSGHSLCLLP